MQAEMSVKNETNAVTKYEVTSIIPNYYHNQSSAGYFRLTIRLV